MSQRASEVIVELAGRWSVDLTNEGTLLLVKYLEILGKWNRTINLVRAAPETWAQIHVGDSLAAVPYLEGAKRLVDVGSGAGLPGIVLAVALPKVEVTALEPIHKKHAFLATVRRELMLDNFRSRAERDSHHRARPDFVPYDAAVSRATWAVDEWLERGQLLVRPQGRVLAMEGRAQKPLPPSAVRHSYDLGDRTRSIVVLDV